jgi:hypothetical protein
MGKSRKLNLRKRKSLKQKRMKKYGGNGCGKCEYCGGEMYLNNKDGVNPPYCICRDCGRSFYLTV